PTAPRGAASPPAQATPAQALAQGAGAAAPGARRVQQDASLTLATAPGRLESVAGQITAAVDRFGGVVQRSSVTADGDSSSQANFDLTIPSRNVEPVLTALSALAHVRSRTQNTQDVTDQYDGLRGQLSQAYAERQGLLRQLAAATTSNATDSIKARLQLLAGRISSLRSQTQALARSTAESRVSITLLADSASASSNSWTLGDAASTALRVLVVVSGAVLIALAVLAPLALLACGAMFLRRRRRESALDRST
ncbi:MAG: DUF4349 domain-containing protein, partial [Solirubrobacteraceae bacterium]